MQTTNQEEGQEQKLTDTAFIIDGKVYRIIHVVRWNDPKTVRMYERMGVESAIYTGIGKPTHTCVHAN